MSRGTDMRFATLLVAIFSLGTLVVGCGESGSEGLSQAAYISQGDAICKQAEAEKDAAVEKAYAQLEKEGALFNPAVGRRLVVEVALPPIQRMVVKLNALGTPNENGDIADAMVDEFEMAASTIASEPDRALTENAQLFESARQLAREYGFELCSQNLSKAGS
jgi:hypothetical protein